MDERNRELMEREALRRRLSIAEARAAELEARLVKTEAAYLSVQRTRLWRLCERWYALRTLLRGGRTTPGAAPPLPAPPRRAASAGRPGGKKVLFISHNAERMGAQIALLHFLRWFAEHGGIPFEILLKRDGPLRPDFEALAPVAVWGEWDEDDELVWLGAAKGTAPAAPYGPGARRLARRLARAGFGLVYSNTLANGLVLSSLDGLGCPVITHAHELDWSIRYHLSAIAELAKARTARYIAASRAVARSLVGTLGVDEGAVDVVYECVPAAGAPPRNILTPAQVRAELHIPENAWLVGASGTTDWRKGSDLFARLARAVYRARPERPVHFVWVGGSTEWRDAGMRAYDLERLGLLEFVHFIGPRRNPLDYYAAFDVFALVSREDPCPLVMLEAASLGKPILCFEESGGAPEFVGKECGYAVPYGDLEGMAARALELLRSPALREAMGRAGAERVRARHDVSVTAPLILAAMRRCMGLPGEAGG